MFLKKKQVSVSLPDSDTYDVYRDATFTVHSSGTLQVKGFIFDSEESETRFYAPGCWKQVWSWQ